MQKQNPSLARTELSSMASLVFTSAVLALAPGAFPRSGGVRHTQPVSQLTAEVAARLGPPPVTMPGDHDILLRAARGEPVDRAPVWLMRQAGRYMKDFRAMSDKYPFRMRSETPEIAIELSLQPWHAFGVDGVIMFSDILTPLPALGIEFDVIKGSGPVITTPLRSMADVKAMTELGDPSVKLPFVAETLRALRRETEGKTSLLGFVGSPFTLVAYAVEGEANRHCIRTKKMMTAAPEVLHAALSNMAVAIGEYACFQIESGAQFIQFFESWAHHIGPSQFSVFAKPYANQAMAYVKARHPDVPIVYYANGGSSYLERQRDMACDMISLDWAVDMTTARATLGADRRVQGNIDPTVLFGSEAQISEAVSTCIGKAGGRRDSGFVLNLGHGVLQGTPEESVRAFVEAAKATPLL